MEHGNTVECIDWYGRPRKGTVITKPNKLGYLWVRIEENLMPGFSYKARVVMNKIYGIGVVPSFEYYDAWLHERYCKVVA